MSHSFLADAKRLQVSRKLKAAVSICEVITDDCIRVVCITFSKQQFRFEAPAIVTSLQNAHAPSFRSSTFTFRAFVVVSYGHNYSGKAQKAGNRNTDLNQK